MTESQTRTDTQDVVLVIHGGAGTLRREALTPEREAAYRATLEEALRAGHRELVAGRSALDAVVAAVRVMEDSPLFNAGKGAVFTHEGRNELDAAIMDGRKLAAGAVAAVTTVKNPVLAARAVMEKSGHVLLAGAGAEAFAKAQGLEMVEPKYFFTQERWDQLQRIRKSEETQLDHDSAPPRAAGEEAEKFGTVGAVARDRQGNLAAATSTGGLTNKRWGRIGDSPLIGAGTYADNATAAVSTTGIGEAFMRSVAAHDLAARMAYQGKSLEDAARDVIEQSLARVGGRGGLIAVDAAGHVAMPFNTEGMYRGVIRADGRPEVMIFK